MNLRNASLHLFAGTLILSTGTVTAVTNGTAQNVSNATELDHDDPRAKRASALVALLAGKDAAGAEKHLKANSIPGSAAAAGCAQTR